MTEQRERMCHDCAFLPGSAEHEPGSAPAYYEGASVLQVKLMQLACSVEGSAPERAFFCHQGMPVDDRGHYAPERDAAGEPAGGVLCAGWAAARAALAGAFEAGGHDALVAETRRRLREGGGPLEGEEAVRP